jgi:NADPH-dependent ferric siderophore reductase
VDIDIVTHGDSGPGSRWALSAVAGDTAGLFGAYAEYDTDPRHRQLIAGDHTALPAIAAILERLPAEARATALVEVGPDDRIELAHPSNAELTWVDACGQPGLALTAAIHALPAEPGYDYAWVAAERQPVAAIRRHLVKERGMAPEQIMFMGYWRSDGAIDELPQ